MSESRYEKEREFHNKTFGEDSRRSAGKFYDIAVSSQRFYQEMLLANCAHAEVLEYGCGQGSQAFELARHGARVTGIDISDVAIEQARERARREGLDGLTFQVMNAEHLEFPDSRFDLVCGSAILHHLDLEHAYSQLTRVLAPSGTAVFSEPLGHNPFINAYRAMTPHLRTEDEHPLLMHDLQLARSYFRAGRIRFFHLQSLAAVPMRNFPGFQMLLRVLDAADNALFAVVPPSRRLAWQAVMVLSKPRTSRVR
jgi:ubiquinone/menaquinone biosynthesis C-methylase UbiE